MEKTLTNAIQKSDEIISKLDSQSGCKTCKNNKLSSSQIWMVVLSVFILVTSIYGTIQIVKDIVDFFK